MIHRDVAEEEAAGASQPGRRNEWCRSFESENHAWRTGGVETSNCKTHSSKNLILLLHIQFEHRLRYALYPKDNNSHHLPPYLMPPNTIISPHNPTFSSSSICPSLLTSNGCLHNGSLLPLPSRQGPQACPLCLRSPRRRAGDYAEDWRPGQACLLREPLVWHRPGQVLGPVLG